MERSSSSSAWHPWLRIRAPHPIHPRDALASLTLNPAVRPCLTATSWGVTPAHYAPTSYLDRTSPSTPWVAFMLALKLTNTSSISSKP